MKNILTILALIILSSCNNEIKKENIIGIWRFDKMINPHEEEEYKQRMKVLDTMTFSEPWDKAYWGNKDPKEIKKILLEEFKNERKIIRENLQKNTKQYLSDGRLIFKNDTLVVDTIRWEITPDSHLIEIKDTHFDTLNIDKLTNDKLVISKVLFGKKASIHYIKVN